MITHVFGFQNKGDHALFEALYDVLVERWPNAKVVAFCRDPVSQRCFFPCVEWRLQFGVGTGRGLTRYRQIIAGLAPLLLLLIPSRLLAIVSMFGSLRLERFYSADLLILCPGGYLEDSRLGIFTNIVNLLPHLRCRGKPIVLAPQSIGPMRSPIVLRIFKLIFAKVDNVCTRELWSASFVLDVLCVPSKRHRQFLDMAFYSCRADHEMANRELANIGIDSPFIARTLIDWYFPGATNIAEAKARYVSEMAKFISETFRISGRKTVVLKQIGSGPGSSGDRAICREVSVAAGKSAVFLDLDVPPAVLRGIIGKAAAFCGCRMHSCIFSLQMGTPTVAVGYLPKTRAIMAGVGLEDCVFDIAEINGRAIAVRLAEIISRRDRFGAISDELRRVAKSEKKDFLDYLAAA